jgi:hypothetical protein
MCVAVLMKALYRRRRKNQIEIFPPGRRPPAQRSAAGKILLSGGFNLFSSALLGW